MQAHDPPAAALASAVSKRPALTVFKAVLLLGCGFLLGLVFRLEEGGVLGGGAAAGLPSGAGGGVRAAAPAHIVPPSAASTSSSHSSLSSSFSAPALQQLRTQLAFPPEVTRVIINVGSSKDPPSPPDDFTAVVAVEPIPATAMAIPRHPLTYVIVAAISNATGFANFFTYNRNGESSTLADLPEAITKSTHSSKWWAQDKVRPPDVPRVLFVPVLTLAMLLEAIPPRVRVAFLKTDMQGFDFTAVSAAGHALRRAEVVQSEVLCHMAQLNPSVIPTNFAFNPNAPPNRFDEDWAGWMEQLGYELVSSPCQGWPTEGDAIWQQAAGCGGPCMLPSPSPSPSPVPPQQAPDAAGRLLAKARV